ncbi:MAG TPA: peptidase [Microscillaceae bacterium]|nr:peptidase [Microscillaceae bacterium]
MKNVRLLNSLMAIAIAAFVFSCQQRETNPTNPNAITDEIKDQFRSLGFDPSDIRYIKQSNSITNEVKEGYLLEKDMFITKANFEAMLTSDSKSGVNGEQYRTNNLVQRLPRTIRVVGYTGGSGTISVSVDADNVNDGRASVGALSNRMRTGLQWAINNFNNINTGLNFQLSFSSNTSGADIIVFQEFNGEDGGIAEFPSRGNPGRIVRLFSGMNSYNNNVNEHVATHEIGHTLGLRHTDFFNRTISCGRGGNEGSGSAGAIHIPGTGTTNNASGFDFNSIMLACFSSNSQGEFSAQDRTALEFLY